MGGVGGGVGVRGTSTSLFLFLDCLEEEPFPPLTPPSVLERRDRERSINHMKQLQYHCE